MARSSEAVSAMARCACSRRNLDPVLPQPAGEVHQMRCSIMTRAAMEGGVACNAGPSSNHQACTAAATPTPTRIPASISQTECPMRSRREVLMPPPTCSASRLRTSA